MKKITLIFLTLFLSFPALAIEPFTVIYEQEWKGVNYQYTQEYKNDNITTELWKGDDGSSYLDYLQPGKGITTFRWQYDGSDFNGERFNFLHYFFRNFQYFYTYSYFLVALLKKQQQYLQNHIFVKYFG
mgnify:CR=1 FL=1